MTTTDAIDALAVRYGVETIPESPDLRFRRQGGPPEPEARPLLEAVKANKAAVLNELARWDEGRERRRLEAAFTWADEISTPGCWAWCHEHRRDLWDELDAAFDAIDTAFGEADPCTLVPAFVRFGEVIRAAVEAHRREAQSAEREQAGREYVAAKARTGALEPRSRNRARAPRTRQPACPNPPRTTAQPVGARC